MSRADDVAEFDAWFERHRSRLRAFAERRLGGLVRERESPSDIVQSAAREVLKACRRHGLRALGALAFRMYRQIASKVVDRHRHHAAAKRLPPGSVRADSQLGEVLVRRRSPLQKMVLEEDLRRLTAALAELPLHYRDVIVWAHIDGLPHAEIARRLGRSEDASKMLLLRAMTRIATVLGVRRSD